MKDKVKTISLQPFPYNLKLIVTDSVVEAEKRIRAKLGDVCTKPTANQNTGAMTMHTRDYTDMFIIMPYKCDVGYIAHEVWHVVRALLLFVGAGLDNEVVAYYIGWLTREAIRFNYKTTKDRDKAKVDNDPEPVIE